jgi:hypothetical protein
MFPNSSLPTSGVTLEEKPLLGCGCQSASVFAMDQPIAVATKRLEVLHLRPGSHRD